MPILRIIPLVLLYLLPISRGLAADETHPEYQSAAPEPPHRQAYLQAGYGHVDFPITCEQRQTQSYFNQAVAMLHGFDTRGADRCFRQVAHLEPDCAMSYWGMALANLNTPDRMVRFIGQAVERKDEASPREQRWIAALAGCIPEEKDGQEEAQIDVGQVAAAFKKLALDDSSDVEAKAFYVRQIYKNLQPGQHVKDVAQTDVWIQSVVSAQMHHPVHGCRALLWESADPHRALASAERALEAAPRNPYLNSLAGRLYARQRRYPEAVCSLEQAVSLFAAQRHRDRRMPDEIPGYAEAKDLLAENLARIGHVREAIGIARQMAEAPGSRASTVDLHLAPDPESHRVLGIRRLTSLFADFELWDELEAWIPRLRFLSPELDTELSYALGRAAFARRQLELGNRQLTKLRYLYADAIDQAFVGGGHKHGHSRDEEKAAKVLPQRVDHIQQFIQNLILCRALATADVETLRERLQRRPDADGFWTPPFYWATGQENKALQIARQAWQQDPGNLSTLARSADFFRQVRQQSKAAELQKQWEQVAAVFDRELPVARRLAVASTQRRTFTSTEQTFTSTEQKALRTDAATASWSEWTWRPYPAPRFTLPDKNGQLHSLKKHRGRPVLLVFYLGAGCPHCIEQLKALAPQKDRFSEAGIHILAVSTDSVEGLELTYEIDGAKELLPFHIVSDQTLDTFLKYGVMNEFRQEPLHGTFLIDRQGRVCWRNISVEPFLDLRFLLKQSRQLLMPAPQPNPAGPPQALR